MRKIKSVIEYDGYKYHGWQVQPNGLSIQEVMEKKLQKIVKKKTILVKLVHIGPKYIADFSKRFIILLG